MPNETPEKVVYDQHTEDVVEASLKPVLGGEPALIIGIVVAAAIALLAITGVVDAETSTAIVVTVVPIVTAVLTRFFVKPVKKKA